jgi:SAM-dependent methyltransferase
MLDLPNLREDFDAIEKAAAAATRAVVAHLLTRPSARGAAPPDVAMLQRLYDQAEALSDRMHRRRTGSRAVNSPEGRIMRATRETLLHWRQAVRATDDALAGHAWPLLPEIPPRLDLAATQAEMVAAAFTRAHRAVNTMLQDDSATAHGCYSDIAYNAGTFAAAVHLAYRTCLALRLPRPLRFLDVGCGGGLKVSFAADYFEEATGFDFDPGYVATAQRAFQSMGAVRCRVFQADGLAWDGYGDFDVVYFFQPMRDQDGLFALERAILAGVREGAVVVAVSEGFGARAEGLGCRRIEGPVFVKGLGEAEREALVPDIRAMGPQVAHPDRMRPPKLGWLRPLWLACEANGIVPG